MEGGREGGGEGGREGGGEGGGRRGGGGVSGHASEAEGYCRASYCGSVGTCGEGGT